MAQRGIVKHHTTALNVLKRHGIPRRRVGLRLMSRKIKFPREKWKLAYLAGIIDGEGSISFVKSTGSWKGTAVRVSVKNTDLKLIRWLKDNFGGYIQEDRYGLKEHPNWKIRYKWGTDATLEVLELLKRVFPYLVIKKDLALKAIAFCEKKLEHFQRSTT